MPILKFKEIEQIEEKQDKEKEKNGEHGFWMTPLLSVHPVTTEKICLITGFTKNEFNQKSRTRNKKDKYGNQYQLQPVWKPVLNQSHASVGRNNSWELGFMDLISLNIVYHFNDSKTGFQKALMSFIKSHCETLTSNSKNHPLHQDFQHKNQIELEIIQSPVAIQRVPVSEGYSLTPSQRIPKKLFRTAYQISLVKKHKNRDEYLKSWQYVVQDENFFSLPLAHSAKKEMRSFMEELNWSQTPSRTTLNLTKLHQAFLKRFKELI